MVKYGFLIRSVLSVVVVNSETVSVDNLVSAVKKWLNLTLLNLKPLKVFKNDNDA